VTLREACDAFGASLTGIVTHDGQPVDGPLMLWAISGNESSFGRDREHVRVEPAYSPGGRYYLTSPELRDYYKRFGALACASLGSFQIMSITAKELGFCGNPADLMNDDVCAQWMSKLIAERFVKHQGATKLSEILDAYNSGSLRDKMIPVQYIRTGIFHYEQGFPTVAVAA
jgi:hypothetical protein